PICESAPLSCLTHPQTCRAQPNRGDLGNLAKVACDARPSDRRELVSSATELKLAHTKNRFDSRDSGRNHVARNCEISYDRAAFRQTRGRGEFLDGNTHARSDGARSTEWGSGPMTHRKGAIWTERLLLGLILISLAATLNLLLAIHRQVPSD